MLALLELLPELRKGGVGLSLGGPQLLGLGACLLGLGACLLGLGACLLGLGANLLGLGANLLGLGRPCRLRLFDLGEPPLSAGAPVNLFSTRKLHGREPGRQFLDPTFRLSGARRGSFSISCRFASRSALVL